MRRYSKFIILAIAFIAASAVLYLFHYYIFHDPHHIFIYMVGDLAFLPLEVFLVVIVIERILAHREKQAVIQKLNMVIGAFFSEVGTQLLHSLRNCFDRSEEICRELTINQDWTHADFKRAMSYADNLSEKPDCLNIDLDALREFLVQKRQFLLRLLENPNLLEHERFTDLLWATFHLTEELEARQSVRGLAEADMQHLSGDIQRVFSRLTSEWLFYAEHLKSNYPYLFSLLVRMHPFQSSPSPLVT